jgi:hypothetical protein
LAQSLKSVRQTRSVNVDGARVRVIDRTGNAAALNDAFERLLGRPFLLPTAARRQQASFRKENLS